MLLFLHGLGGNRRNWGRQITAFSDRFTAAAWDARGYGDSDDYPGSLQFTDFTSDVLRVADHFRQDRIHLVGLSMGGRIARNFALQHPQRVATLVLANTHPGFDALPSESVKAFVAERCNLQPAMQARRLIGSGARPGAYEELVASMTALRLASYMKTLEASVAQDRAAPIEEIRAPTLVLTSDQDPLYPPEVARDMVRRIPGAELAVIEGAGHLSNLEQPERFNAALLEFLARH